MCRVAPQRPKLCYFLMVPCHHRAAGGTVFPVGWGDQGLPAITHCAKVISRWTDARDLEGPGVLILLSGEPEAFAGSMCDIPDVNCKIGSFPR